MVASLSIIDSRIYKDYNHDITLNVSRLVVQKFSQNKTHFYNKGEKNILIPILVLTIVLSLSGVASADETDKSSSQLLKFNHGVHFGT